MNDTTWWYIARSGGIVGWALLAGSVLWGLALSTKVLHGKPRPNWILDLHRFLGGLAVVFVAVHVISLMVHRYMRFSIGEALIPGVSTFKPAAVAWGIIGWYLLLAVEITSLLRKRMSKRSWKAVHYLSFPLFALATVHGLQAGTDRRAGLFVIANVVVVVVVVALTVMRLAKADQHDLMTAPPAGVPPRRPAR